MVSTGWDKLLLLLEENCVKKRHISELESPGTICEVPSQNFLFKLKYNVSLRPHRPQIPGELIGHHVQYVTSIVIITWLHYLCFEENIMAGKNSVRLKCSAAKCMQKHQADPLACSWLQSWNLLPCGSEDWSLLSCIHSPPLTVHCIPHTVYQYQACAVHAHSSAWQANLKSWLCGWQWCAMCV